MRIVEDSVRVHLELKIAGGVSSVTLDPLRERMSMAGAVVSQYRRQNRSQVVCENDKGHSLALRYTGAG